MSKQPSLEYLIGLSKLSGKSFNQTMERLVSLLPDEDKPIQLVKDDSGNLVDVREYVKEKSTITKPIGFIQQ